MNIGDEITIRAKIVDFDSNPHGASVKVEIKGFADNGYVSCLRPFEDNIRFLIRRTDIKDIIVEEK